MAFQKLTIRFKLDPDSAALVRQSFRTTDAEKRPHGGLEVLSGRFSLGPFPGLKAWAVLFSAAADKNVQTAGGLLAAPGSVACNVQKSKGSSNFRVHGRYK
jgi:hypothetical protein